MAKKKDSKHERHDHSAVLTTDRSGSSNGKSEQRDSDAELEGREKISRKEFDKEILKLQVELVKMQEWVKATGARVCVVFEGRDTAGKGGIIKRITERTSPRVFRVVALSAPSEREKSQMYIQRYI